MESKDEKEKVEELSPTLRGIDISILGNRNDIVKFKDVAFLEMPDFLVEHDDDGPFLKVVTEKVHYEIRLTRAEGIPSTLRDILFPKEKAR